MRIRVRKRLRSWFNYPWTIRMVAWFVHKFLHLLFRTCKVEVEDRADFKQLFKKQGCIMVFWHHQIVPVAPFFFKELASDPNHPHFTTVVSASRDGQLLHYITNQYKGAKVIEVARGKKHRVVPEIIEACKRGEIVLITPDGPRGPREQLKNGCVLAAEQSGVPLVPFCWEADRMWELKTWDRMRIPKPFSRIKIRVGKPLTNEQERSTLTQQMQF